MVGEKCVALVVVLDALLVDVGESFLHLFMGIVLWRGSFSLVHRFSES